MFRRPVGGPRRGSVGSGARPSPAGCCGSAADAHVPSPDRCRHDGRDRQGRERPLHPRSLERRFRSLRGRSQAGPRVDDGRQRRARHQCARSGAARAARRRDPAGGAPRERHVRPHLSGLPRRLASAVSGNRPRPAARREDREGADSRRRHVRHRVERPFVDLDRHDLRQAAPERCAEEGHRRRHEAERNHQHGQRLGGSDRASPSRARGVLDDARGAHQPGESPQSPQGARLGQRGLRLQSVPGLTSRLPRSVVTVPAEPVEPDAQPGHGRRWHSAARQRSAPRSAAAAGDLQRRRSRDGSRRDHARGQPREHDDLHDRPARA